MGYLGAGLTRVKKSSFGTNVGVATGSGDDVREGGQESVWNPDHNISGGVKKNSHFKHHC